MLDYVDQNDRPRPPAPEPLEKPLSVLGFLRKMRISPIECLTRAHYEEPLVVSPTIMGPVLFICSRQALRHVLVENASNYVRERVQKKILTGALGEGLLAVEQEQWRVQRKITGPYFAPRRVSRHADAVTSAARSLVERWSRLPDGGRVEISYEMSMAMIDVLEGTIFRDGICKDRDKYARAVTRYLKHMRPLDPLDAINVPRWMPRFGYLLSCPSIALFRRTAETVIGARRRRLANGSSSAPDDLVTLLMESRDGKTGRGLSATEVRDNITTFIFAGYETGANALAWSIYLLTLDDEWRRRVEAEADRELPEGHYVDGSLDRLAATRAVIEEAMRLYPPVPLTVRQAIEADSLDGRDIAPGTIVAVAPWLVHRHHTLWQAPDRFDPCRFMPGKRESVDRFAFIPFGAGPRVCVGAAFAMQETVIMLASIARSFRLELAPDHRVWPEHCITLRPKGGLPMILHRRRGETG